METLVTAWRKCKKSFFNGNQDFHFTIDEGRHDKSLPLRCLLGRSRWREGRAAVMLISVLSQEQLHRRSPVPVLGAREVRAEGVKPQGSLGLAQPATAMGKIKFPEFHSCSFFGSLGVYSGIQMGSKGVQKQLLI